MNMKDQETGFVFIHGAGLRGWIWDQTMKGLQYPSLAVEYPGRKEPNASLDKVTLSGYTDYILSQIDSFGPQQYILVAHSIGGILGARIAGLRKNKVIGFVAMSAIISDMNESFISNLPLLQRMFLPILLQAAGTRPPDNVIRKTLCYDVSDPLTQKVIDTFTPESVNLYTEKAKESLNLPHPVYVLLEKDRNLTTATQMAMAKKMRSDEIIRVSSGHLPMLTSPDKISHILNTYADKHLHA